MTKREAVPFLRLFPKLRVFSIYRISGAAMGGAEGAQRPVLRIIEPEKTGARGAGARSTAITS